MRAGDRPVDGPRRRVLLLPLRREAAGTGEPPEAASYLGDDGLDVLVRMLEQALVAETSAQVAQAVLAGIADAYGLDRSLVLSGELRLRVLARHPAADGPGHGSGGSAAVERAQTLQAAQLLLGLAADEPFLAGLLGIGVDAVVLPLTADGRGLGAVVVQVPSTWRESPRLNRTTDQLERVTRNVALILAGLNRRAQLQRLAATDDLTKIANRRSFTASLERELARSGRSGEPVSLVILDIDHFKQVNDEHGHVAGDEALRNVAASLAVACREFDTPARYGGEEFAVILPDCSRELSIAVAERFRAAVAAAPAVRPLTASAGVATFPDHASTAEQLVRAADEALLLAKRSGRDRTLSAGRQERADGAAARRSLPGQNP